MKQEIIVSSALRYCVWHVVLRILMTQGKKGVIPYVKRLFCPRHAKPPQVLNNIVLDAILNASQKKTIITNNLSSRMDDIPSPSPPPSP